MIWFPISSLVFDDLKNISQREKMLSANKKQKIIIGLTVFDATKRDLYNITLANSTLIHKAVIVH